MYKQNNYIMQNKVEIVNIQRSGTDGKTFESTIFESLWLKNEAKLKKEGWLLKSTIEKIEVVKTEDNLGLEEVEIVEAEEVDYKSLSKAEVIAELEKREIEFHHASKKSDLIELLK